MAEPMGTVQTNGGGEGFIDRVQHAVEPLIATAIAESRGLPLPILSNKISELACTAALTLTAGDSEKAAVLLHLTSAQFTQLWNKVGRPDPENVYLASVRPEPLSMAGPEKIVPLAEMERIAIQNALRITGGNLSRSCRELGIGRATLYRRLKKFGIDRLGA